MAQSRLKNVFLWNRKMIFTSHLWNQLLKILGTAIRIGFAFVSLHTFVRYVGGLGLTTGVSMMPTIPYDHHSRPIILYSTLHRRGRGIKVGDVITYKHPLFSKEESGCKRVIGMPGDFVSVITPGRRDEDVESVDVDNKWSSVKEEVIQVPEGHCWVAGDNLEWSRDSRLFGPLPLGLVQSKVLAVVLPWKHAKWIGSDMDVKNAQGGEKEWVSGK